MCNILILNSYQVFLISLLLNRHDSLVLTNKNLELDSYKIGEIDKFDISNIPMCICQILSPRFVEHVRAMRVRGVRNWNRDSLL